MTACDFDRKSPFALVLVGQPLLRERLGEPQHYSLAQRIGVRLRLRPLSETEIMPFLDRHLKAAGAKKNPFEPDAVGGDGGGRRRAARRLQEPPSIGRAASCVDRSCRVVPHGPSPHENNR